MDFFILSPLLRLLLVISSIAPDSIDSVITPNSVDSVISSIASDATPL